MTNLLMLIHQIACWSTERLWHMSLMLFIALIVIDCVMLLSKKAQP